MKYCGEYDKKDSVIIFWVDSQFEYCNWNELFNRNDILNRGIAGDITSGLLGRIEEVCRHNPSKIFIEIGTNDLSMGLSIVDIMKDYERLIEEIQNRTTAKIYINSVLPVEDLPGENYQNTEILNLNRKLKDLCVIKKMVYIDLTEKFTNDDSGNLKTEFTTDGLHLNSAGYLEWKKYFCRF
ncbi:MAG: hypothetical protein HC803_01555 [Saprospiraceae bacterium]|nr:hypothetical protein [Saprospiraceae bacterium]